MNRLVRVQVSAELIVQVLQSGMKAVKVVKNPLPQDAVLTGVQYDGRTASLIFQSDTFAELLPGEFIPSYDPFFENVEPK